jgi:hypothetical protein
MQVPRQAGDVLRRSTVERRLRNAERIEVGQSVWFSRKLVALQVSSLLGSLITVLPDICLMKSAYICKTPWRSLPQAATSSPGTSSRPTGRRFRSKTY